MPSELESRLDALKPVWAEHGIGLAVLFGSWARGTERPGSDLDLGVLRRDGRPLDYRAFASLHLALSRQTGMEVDLVDLSTHDAVLRLEIVSVGRLLFEAAAGTWKDFVARALIDWDDIGPFVKACVAAVGRAAVRGSQS